MGHVIHVIAVKADDVLDAKGQVDEELDNKCGTSFDYYTVIHAIHIPTGMCTVIDSDYERYSSWNSIDKINEHFRKWLRPLADVECDILKVIEEKKYYLLSSLGDEANEIAMLKRHFKDPCTEYDIRKADYNDWEFDKPGCTSFIDEPNYFVVVDLHI